MPYQTFCAAHFHRRIALFGDGGVEHRDGVGVRRLKQGVGGGHAGGCVFAAECQAANDLTDHPAQAVVDAYLCQLGASCAASLSPAQWIGEGEVAGARSDQDGLVRLSNIQIAVG
jgi:hypothetical protein